MNQFLNFILNNELFLCLILSVFKSEQSQLLTAHSLCNITEQIEEGAEVYLLKKTNTAGWRMEGGDRFKWGAGEGEEVEECFLFLFVSLCEGRLTGIWVFGSRKAQKSSLYGVCAENSGKCRKPLTEAKDSLEEEAVTELDLSSSVKQQSSLISFPDQHFLNPQPWRLLSKVLSLVCRRFRH